MAHPDQNGYYRILGVSSKASAAAIKKAFRQRSKELHPDHNPHIGAAEQFSALSDAYQVLNDPEARARYDTRGLEVEAPGDDPTGREVDSPVPCSRCKKVSAQPRYVIFHQVVGEFTHVSQDRIQGIYCPRCARDLGVTASLMTWVLGWWGFPDGPVQTVKAVWCNIRGGEIPRTANHQLLAYQARAFEKAGNTPLALALAQESLAMEPDGRDVADMKRLLRQGDPPVLKDLWRMSPWVALVQLAPVFLFVLGFFLMVLPSNGSEVTPLPPRVAMAPQPMYHVAADGVILRAGPFETQAAVSYLTRFESVSVANDYHGGEPEQWVPVVVGSQAGFVRTADLAPGSGPDGLRAWCGEGAMDRPANGAILARNASGPHAVAVQNRTDLDQVVKLRDMAGQTVAAFYVHAAKEARLTGVPEGEYQVIYGGGRDYSLACGTFLSDMVVHATIEPLSLISRIEGSNLYAKVWALNLGVDAEAVPIDPAIFTDP